MKTCTKCKLEKELSQFYKHPNGKDGYDSRCKACRCSTERDYHSRNKEAISSRTKARRQADPEAQKEKRKIEYERNKEQILKRQKAYYESNKQTPAFKFSQLKQGAKDRNKGWSLSFDQFMEFWQADCSYCGDPIPTIGLDRIDSSKGYELGNVRPSCGICNWMKLDLTEEEFMLHIAKIHSKASIAIISQ
jgi:hypothetical protein